MINRTLALLAALVFSAPAAAFSATTATAATRITASGEGTVALTPDVATVQASIETNDDRAAVATSQNNAIYDRVLAAVAKNGVARNDVTYANYYLNYNPRPPVRPGEAAPPGPFGYTVTRTFDVKVRAVANVGSVVDALVGAGTTNINSVSFAIADPSSARGEAIARAYALARSRAEAVARAAGLHITGIEQIDNGGAYVAPLVKAGVSADVFMAARGAVPTTLDSGSVNVTANVTVVFLAR